MLNLFKHKRHPHELLALTGIRGIAAFFVVLSHINLFFISTFHVQKIVYVQPFVDLFFVLSGFVISLVYIKKAEWTRAFFYKFFSARFARIYPLYIVALIVSGAITVLAIRSSPHSVHNADAISKSAIVTQLFLLSAMPFFYCKMLILTSWSVSIEWWLYIILFPLLMLLKNFRAFLAKPICMIFILGLLIVYLYQPKIAEAATISWPAFARGLVGFYLGWLTYWHFSNKTKLSELCAKYATHMLLVSVCLLVILPLFIPTQPWIGLLLFPFLILGLSFKGSTATKIFSNTFIVVLGDISYSVYLLHPIVLSICSTILRKFIAHDKVFLMVFYTVITLAGTLILSYLSYLFIESPLRTSIYNGLTKKSNNAK